MLFGLVFVAGPGKSSISHSAEGAEPDDLSLNSRRRELDEQRRPGREDGHWARHKDGSHQGPLIAERGAFGSLWELGIYLAEAEAVWPPRV